MQEIDAGSLKLVGCWIRVWRVGAWALLAAGGDDIFLVRRYSALCCGYVCGV